MQNSKFKMQNFSPIFLHISKVNRTFAELFAFARTF